MSEIPNILLNVLVLEHDLQEQKRCCDLIEKILPGTMTFGAQYAKEAINIVRHVQIDAAIIDKSIPDIDGFNAASKIVGIEHYMILPMIFIARADDHSIKKSKFPRHFSFITKPYSDDEFINEVSLLLKGLLVSKSYLIEYFNSKQSSYVVITANGETHRVVVSDILYAETVNRRIHLCTKKEVFKDITKMTLDELINHINSDSFIRCHRAFAANIENIVDIKRTRDRVHDAYFSSNLALKCPIGKTYFQLLYDKWITQ
jgi:DNA-binding LytR/AlgR family response regulator